VEKQQERSKTSLTILPDKAPLRSKRGVPSQGPFLDPVEWPPASENEVPRALRGLARIVDGGLCHRCGSCVGICPTKVLGRDEEEFPTVVNLSACTDCDLCVKVCPGDEFDFHSMHQAKFGTPGKEHETHGNFIHSAIAHSTDPMIQERSTSGGLVTAILLDLLERGEIDGAVTIASDSETLWKGRPQIARTREEVLAAMKSKYAISPTNTAFSEIRDVPGKYALVGLPCQIHGFLKAAELDARIRDRVVLTIGLFCHAAIEHEAFEVIWEQLGDKTKNADKFISRIGKHPGTPHLGYPDGSSYPVYFGDKEGYRPSSMEIINILYRLYTPDRCLTCFDSTSEFADIAIGDPWMTPPEDSVNFYDGWSFTLIRNKKALSIYNRLIESQKIVSVDVTRKEALDSNNLMATEKRWRAFRIIETQRRQGKPIPEYHVVSPRHSLSHFVKTELHMISHVLCYLPRLRRPVLAFMLGNGGYSLLWLNNKRRRFRFWRRDTIAKIKRAMFGRQ
jgi:coenzyme F420 hydrogenase subunit beta